jgi:hypothetical protein
MKASRPRRRMKCVETPDSSSIARFCYEERKHVLVVEFKHGAAYNYYDVPQRVFEQMIAAPSKGRFFLKNVREEYDYTQV